MTKNVRKTVSTFDLRTPVHAHSVFEHSDSSATVSRSSMTAQFSDDLRRIQKHFNGGASPPSTASLSPIPIETIHAPSKAVTTSKEVENTSSKASPGSQFSSQSSPSQQPDPFADMSTFKEMSVVLDSLGRGELYEKPELDRGAKLDYSATRLAPKRAGMGFNGKNPQLNENDAAVQPRHVLEHPRRSKNDIAADYTKPFCDFLTDNPTVFHTVTAFSKELADAGYKKISERDAWKIKKGEKYFVERNGSSMIAFSVGDDYEPGNGAAMVAGHIDALTAKLKPIPKLKTKAGYVQLGVAPYAGALNSTWWDRDLSIGGRVLVKEPSGKISSKLVQLNWPSKYFGLHQREFMYLTGGSRPHSNSSTALRSRSVWTIQYGDANGPYHRPGQQ
jgi:hypothetical protein